MNVLDKLAAFDERIVRDAFQPVQDAVSRWRRQSDHLLAVFCFLASACFGLLRGALDGASGVDGARYAGCFLALVTASLVQLYGQLNRNAGAPGLFAAGMPVSILLRLAGALSLTLSLASLGFEAHPLQSALNGIGDLIWLMGACFAGCMLKRPAPPRRVSAPASSLVAQA